VAVGDGPFIAHLMRAQHYERRDSVLILTTREGARLTLVLDLELAGA